MPCGNEPERVQLHFMGFLSREPRLLSLFSDTGKQPKPICFFSKGRSGVSGKAYIEGCAIVSRGNVEVLFWPKHPRGMPVRRHRRTHAHQERFGVIHVRPSWWPPPNQKWDRPGLLSRERVMALREPVST